MKLWVLASVFLFSIKIIKPYFTAMMLSREVLPVPDFDLWILIWACSEMVKTNHKNKDRMNAQIIIVK